MGGGDRLVGGSELVYFVCEGAVVGGRGGLALESLCWERQEVEGLLGMTAMLCCLCTRDKGQASETPGRRGAPASVKRSRLQIRASWWDCEKSLIFSTFAYHHFVAC